MKIQVEYKQKNEKKRERDKIILKFIHKSRGVKIAKNAEKEELNRRKHFTLYS